MYIGNVVLDGMSAALRRAHHVDAQKQYRQEMLWLVGICSPDKGGPRVVTIPS